MTSAAGKIASELKTLTAYLTTTPTSAARRGLHRQPDGVPRSPGRRAAVGRRDDLRRCGELQYGDPEARSPRRGSLDTEVDPWPPRSDRRLACAGEALRLWPAHRRHRRARSHDRLRQRCRAGSPHARETSPVTGASTAPRRRQRPPVSTCGVSCTSYETAINKYFTDVAADSGTATNVYGVANQYCQGIAVLSHFLRGQAVRTSRTTRPSAARTWTERRSRRASATTRSRSISSSTATSTASRTHSFRPRSRRPSRRTAGRPTRRRSSSSSRRRTSGSVNSPARRAISTTARRTPSARTTTRRRRRSSTQSFPMTRRSPSGGCDSGLVGTEPVGAGADASLSSISHEHNEAITDPYGDGWWAADGSENGDLCAYNFGDSARDDADPAAVQPGHQRHRVLPPAGVQQRRRRLPPATGRHRFGG